MNTTTRTKLCTAVYLTLGTAALCALSVSVEASDLDVQAKTVKFADLNISNPTGAKILYRRISAAAQDVCVRTSGTDPILRAGTRACMDKAIDKAVNDVNSPALTSLRFGSGDVRLASK